MADKEQDLLREAMKRFEAGVTADQENRQLMEEDFAFAAGEQWPETVVKTRTAQDRACLTFNRLPQFIQQVVGDARQNRPSVKVHPVDSGADKNLAEIYEGLIRNIEGQSRAIRGISGRQGLNVSVMVNHETTLDDRFADRIATGKRKMISRPDRYAVILIACAGIFDYQV